MRARFVVLLMLGYEGEEIADIEATVEHLKRSSHLGMYPTRDQRVGETCGEVAGEGRQGEQEGGDAGVGDGITGADPEQHGGDESAQRQRPGRAGYSGWVSR